MKLFCPFFPLFLFFAGVNPVASLAASCFLLLRVLGLAISAKCRLSLPIFLLLRHADWIFNHFIFAYVYNYTCSGPAGVCDVDQ